MVEPADRMSGVGPIGSKGVKAEAVDDAVRTRAAVLQVHNERMGEAGADPEALQL